MTNRTAIGAHISGYFQDLFESSHPVFDEDLESLFSLVITNVENGLLCCIPNEAEICSAISQLGLTKAPGPDGFTGLLYKTYWHTSRLSVIKFVQSFFWNG